ncbi:hypothetical protein Tco_0453988 [Tanacetum coccineum]
MRTRSQSRNRQQQQVPQTFVEPFDLEEPIDNPAPPVVTMADNRTMAQLLQAPTEGYEDAIVVPAITADNFELKHGVLERETRLQSNLKRCLADANLHVPLNEIKVDKTLRFVEEPLEIIDREVKTLKRSKIPIVKVRWNSKHGPAFNWEREDYVKAKYP